VQSEQTPFEPHAESAPPCWQVPLVAAEQHPPLHGVPFPHATVHVPFVHASRTAGQSKELPHPHWPPPFVASHLWPVLAVAQLAQVPPVLPQAPSAVPSVQVPPLAAEQQPPLQGETALQAAEQRRVCASQACPDGQSLALRQPHESPPLPTMHTRLAEHALHVGPRSQAPGWSPRTHTPPLQHPPLQVAFASQVIPQVPLVQAAPTGQSLLLAQPHVPFGRHAGVAGSPLHTAHAPPVSPHAAGVPPATQVDPSQQPPLHARPPAHDAEHVPVSGSHALPAEQSLGAVQPQTPLTHA
jgi:hypothetical protein